MPARDSFQALVDRLRAGDEAAAARVFHRFAGRLIALARSQLGDPLGRKLDPEDVLQSVFRSFFRRQREGQFDLENWDSLWGVLTVMTLRKCGRLRAHYAAARRDVRREVPLEGPPSPLPALARGPTPEEAAALTDLVEQLFRGLDERERDILALHLQGHSHAEVSARVGRAERTVRRVLERARKRLARLDVADEDIPA